MNYTQDLINMMQGKVTRGEMSKEEVVKILQFALTNLPHEDVIDAINAEWYLPERQAIAAGITAENVETHPVMRKAIKAAEEAFQDDMTPASAYMAMFKAAFIVAKQHDLSDEDATVIATSAATDGQSDSGEGYKNFIAPRKKRS
jgi:hypothetical protein